MTNKELIQKIKNIDNLYDYDLQNKQVALTQKTLREFVNQVNDDDENTPFDLSTGDYDLYIDEIAEMCTPSTYSELTGWLAYDNEHIFLLNECVDDTGDDLLGFNIISELSNTITNVLKWELITILTNITKQE